MNRTRIKDIITHDYIDKTVTVCGWIRTKRESKGISFIALSDGSTQDALQLVIPRESPIFSQLSLCNTGAAIKVVGTIRLSPGKGQQVEVEVSDLEIYGDADQESYPLQKKGHSLEFLREIAHLRPRTNTFGAVFRVRNVLAQAAHNFFQHRGFIWIHTPIITASDCEGAGDLFTITSLNFNKLPQDDNGNISFINDFFGRRAFLTVSGQLEAEFLAMALCDVYTFGPTFRAENSNTSRHLSEFWMIEPEMAFADLTDDMKLAEEFIHSLCREVAKNCADELMFLETFYKNTSLAELERLSDKPFIHISYTDAVKELKSAKVTFEFPVEWGLDLQSEHEKFLTDTVFKGPVIVTDYPKEIKAFYMRLNPDEKTVAAMDVLMPKVGEIIGGSQREERLEILNARINELGVPWENIEWYLDLRRYGSAPHAGFGLGFERFVQYITGMPNIRDVIPCPRSPKSIKF